MGYYVQRVETGAIVGLYASFQEGFAEEFLEDDNPEVIAFLNPPEVLLPITKRQLRLTLVRNGIALSTVEAAIASMPEGLPKEEAKIEWDDASTFNRNHPTLLLIASALGMTEAQVDAMWREAVTA
ncbi:hypothetical protein [Agrobacterium radiobacter]|uniref:hypothetical protein n=1 Tax=Agrobacterium radiobacter TaxID=362 RepID=UPI0016068E9C|nr:hypothetical protein [Agrobacterium radiobacter]MBB4407105.1 hypothetical protein [Agrobacterium radiobacter]MBB4452691.1 hypothetical protein [Agrobacterium radiobacter]